MACRVFSLAAPSFREGQHKRLSTKIAPGLTKVDVTVDPVLDYNGPAARNSVECVVSSVCSVTDKRMTRLNLAGQFAIH
jgi:hypothetical protein